MINHINKFIFLHIPKTGGMSIGQTLYNLMGVTKKYDGFRIHHDEFDEDIFRDYFVFTFVRNPWDRLYSQYKFRPFLKEHNFEYAVNNLEDLFEQELGGIPDSAKYTLNTPIQTVSDGSGEFIHLASQVEFLQGKFSQNVDRLPFINFIGRFENLQEDFNYVCSKIGIPQTQLLHMNRGNSSTPYKDIYNKELVEKTRKKFSDDISYFNYEF